MRFKSRTTLVLLLVPLCLATAPAVAARALVLGYGSDPGNPRSEAAHRFAKLVSQYTDGKLTVQTHGSEQLGSDVQMLQQVQSGSLDLSANSQGPLATIIPEANVFGLPFLFESSQAAWKVADGPIGDKIAKLAAQRGIKVLAWWSNGLRDITNNKRPIKKPGDLKGLKIRTPKDPMTISIFKNLGANPTPMAFGELYVALKQGTVDGQENPLVNIWSTKLYEVQKYLSITHHKYETTPFVASMATWKSLSKKQQNAVRKAAKKAGQFERHELVKQTNNLLPKLKKKGMKVNHPDIGPFRAATKPVYAHWRKKLGPIVKKIQKAAKKANNAT